MNECESPYDKKNRDGTIAPLPYCQYDDKRNEQACAERFKQGLLHGPRLASQSLVDRARVILIGVKGFYLVQ